MNQIPWSDGQQGLSANNVKSGIYSLQINYDDGCIYEEGININDVLRNNIWIRII